MMIRRIAGERAECRARLLLVAEPEAADWVLALLSQSTPFIRSLGRSLEGSTIVRCRSKTLSAMLGNFLSVSSRFIWPRSAAASRPPSLPPSLPFLLRSATGVADVCPSIELQQPLPSPPPSPSLAFSGLSQLCCHHRHSIALPTPSSFPSYSTSPSFQISRNVRLNER